MTKMTDAFKKIFLGLGGDPKELSENNDVGDFILDLEYAIKKTASNVINDSEASDTTTYSSNKITSLIPEAKDPEYLKVMLSNMAAEYAPTITFPNSYSREKFVNDIAEKTPSVLYLSQFAFDSMTKWIGNISLPLMMVEQKYVIYHGIAEYGNKYYELFFKIGRDASDDAFYYKEFEFPTT